MSLQEQVDRFLDSGRAQAAADLIARRLSRRDGEAAFVLAGWHMVGFLVPRNISRARSLFRQAHEWGHHPATRVFAALLGSGAGNLPRDWPGSLRLLSSSGKSDPLLAEQLRLIAAMPVDELGNPLEPPQRTLLAAEPRIVVFRQFLSPEECAAVIATARDSLRPAMVVSPRTGKLIRDPVRDSQAIAFPFMDESPFLHVINRRIAAATSTTPEQGEPVQVLHYRPGQQYRLHSDALPDAANQRILTFLVYLNDDYTGGETHFPAGDLSIRCASGDAICFANVTADGQPDPVMRHAGMPVISGEKFLLSRWIRNRPLDLGLANQPW